VSHPTPDSAQTLAVFDLDGTLIRGDSFLPFVVGYARARRRLRPLVTLPLWLSLYAARLVPDHRAKERVLVSFFRGECPARVGEYAATFAESWVRPRLCQPVFARLADHLSAGHRVILLSASPDLCVEAVGRTLGIGEVLCTRTRRTPTACEGELDGPNCKGEQKLVRLRAHLGMDAWGGASFAYGDSSSDLPVLRWATHGFLVDRRGELTRVSPVSPPELIRS
jgi:phosphatidylglycerophosphatase C